MRTVVICTVALLIIAPMAHAECYECSYNSGYDDGYDGIIVLPSSSDQTPFAQGYRDSVADQQGANLDRDEAWQMSTRVQNEAWLESIGK